MEEKIKQLIGDAQKIVIIQADNPDADSLGSSLALEHILGDISKDVYLYCGVDMPTYLRYLSGWDRVRNELPRTFDLSIIVDASTYTLFGQIEKGGHWGWIKNRPNIILDHHATVDHALEFASAMINDDSKSSTGELIFNLAQHNGWNINKGAAEHIMGTILGDTQGLINDKTTAATYRVMADLTDLGANRPLLEDLRREYSRMPESIFRYKGELIKRMEFAAGERIAMVTIPQDEINEYSPLYNPAVLVQFDSLQVANVQISIVFKTYDNGKITGKLRTNFNAPIADKLAEHFGGGGHAHSAGFKIEDSRKIEDIRTDCIQYTQQLLDNLDQTSEASLE